MTSRGDRPWTKISTLVDVRENRVVQNALFLYFSPFLGCNCNNHASRCHFDRAVYETSGYVSGGVCDDCMHNTMGKNCEQCKPYFYREPGREISDPYVCRGKTRTTLSSQRGTLIDYFAACECDLRGSLNQGICDTETDPTRNLVAGRCHCKKHVDGERCDRCKNGFWNMDQDNGEGCIRKFLFSYEIQIDRKSLRFSLHLLSARYCWQRGMQ